MMLGTLMMAAVIRLAYPSWSWDLALLLGTITSATDPVAVVAMLRELGAKVSLSTTIEGESLMNDGSAVVLFVVLNKIAQAGGVVGEPVDIVIDFLRMAVLGPVLGWAFGNMALAWISHVFNDPLVEISISIIVAYLAFYISEFWVHSSGVLTVVFTGLSFSSTFGRTSISPEVFHFLHEFWETLGYIANTIIFLITGIAIAYNAYDIEFTGQDIAISFLIYAAGIVIRMLLFVFTFPLFKKLPYGWSWQEALIAAWGGLRGAVGLALGLQVMFTNSALECPTDGPPNIGCSEVKGRILLHTSMMVVLTLLINASTLKPLLAVLRFVELSHEELTMLAHVAERLKKDAVKEMQRIQEDPFLSNSNWEIVRQYADLNELFRPLLKGMAAAKKVVGHAMEDDDGASAQGSPSHASRRSRFSHGSEAEGHSHPGPRHRLEVPDVLMRESIDVMRTSLADGGGVDGASEETNLLSELKYHYHMSLKAGIWHLQHQGTLGASATDILVDALNHKLDDKHSVDWIRWSELQTAGGEHHGFRLPAWMRVAREWPIIGRVVNQFLSSRLQMWHDIAFGFLTVHEHLEHEVEHWTHDHKLVSTLHEVLHDNAEGARKSLIDLQEVLPEVCLTVNTRQAARLMLNATREKVHALEAQGLLPEPQAKAMVAQVETQMRKLQLDRFAFDLSKEKVLREVSWMSELNEETFQIIVAAATERNYAKGEYLVRQGDVPVGENESVFLVARGIVEIVEEYANGDSTVVARRGSGVVIGEQSLLTSAPRAASARAATSVVALGLSHGAMQRAMENYTELADRMWHHVGLNLAQKLLGDAEEQKYGERLSTAEELKAAAEEWVPSIEAVQAFSAGENFHLEGKVLLLHGACIEYVDSETPPTLRQLEDLQLSLRREADEAREVEQQAIKQTIKREKTRGRRLSLHAAFFGAGGGAQDNTRTTPGRGLSSAKSIGGNMLAALSPVGDSSPAVTAKEIAERAAAATKLALDNGHTAPVHAVELGRERRSLHQQSPWIIHLAPCLINVPTGGREASHEIQCLSSCRLAIEPAREHGLPSHAPHGNHAVELSGAPLQLLTSPHELRPSLISSLSRKLTPHRYQPGETIFDASSLDGDASIVIIFTGSIACDVTRRDGGAAAEGDGMLAAGEPFATGGSAKRAKPYVFTPEAGSVLGEWLLLQPNLAAVPRVVAHNFVTAVTVSEDALTAALQQEDQLAANLWWARTQRETFCFLRKLEPFCWWQHSKLWRWVSDGKHVKVPEGRGQLGTQAPFVVLIQGRCHISYNEHAYAKAGAQPGVAPSATGEGARLGSLKLLGSGARIADLLTFTSMSSGRGKGGASSPLTTPHGSYTPSADGKWVPSPEVIHCHEEISYHFARDSLVFIASDRMLPWLPTNLVFSTPTPAPPANGSPDSPPFGIRSPWGSSPEPRSDSPAYDSDPMAA